MIVETLGCKVATKWIALESKPVFAYADFVVFFQLFFPRMPGREKCLPGVSLLFKWVSVWVSKRVKSG